MTGVHWMQLKCSAQNISQQEDKTVTEGNEGWINIIQQEFSSSVWPLTASVTVQQPVKPLLSAHVV